MSRTEDRIRTLYEISLSIRARETVSEAATEALSCYLRKLDCSAGAVLTPGADATAGEDYDTVAAVPERPTENDSLRAAVERIPPADRRHDEVRAALPLSGRVGEDHYYVMDLPEFGLLVLVKSTPSFEEETVTALEPLNEKFAAALQRTQAEERQRTRERTLEHLVRRTSELVDTTDMESTARVAVRIARDVLDAPLTGVHLLSDDERRLEPVAMIDEAPDGLDEPPSYDRTDDETKSELVWEAFEEGEVLYVEDTHDHETLAAETPARSAVIQPLGGHGVFIVSTTEPGRLDETDRTLVQLTAQTLQATLDRVDREAELRERQRRLAAQTAKLETVFEAIPEPAVRVEFTEEGTLLRAVNEAFETTFGYEAPEVLGEDINDLIVPDDDPAMEAARRIDEQAKRGERHLREVRREAADGMRDFLFRSAPLTREEEEVNEQFGAYIDITTQKERERELERFAYVISHDLREPLRAISNYLQLIGRRHGEDLNDEAAEFLEFAVDGAERLDEMIRSLLTYARVDTDSSSFAPTEMEAVYERVEKNLRVKIAETDAELTAGPLPTVEGDEDRLVQLLQNLVENGIKYTDAAPPRVEVTATPHEDGYRFAVADDGIGMTEEDSEHVFDIFERVHPDDGYEGTGIGLAVCRKIVERHGGRIWVESEPGEGSTVYFTLREADTE